MAKRVCNDEKFVKKEDEEEVANKIDDSGLGEEEDELEEIMEKALGTKKEGFLTPLPTITKSL